MEETFSVEGRRVTVGGAARSGIAAALLLARRGATVTLSEQRESVDQADELVAAYYAAKPFVAAKMMSTCFSTGSGSCTTSLRLPVSSSTTRANSFMVISSGFPTFTG